MAKDFSAMEDCNRSANADIHRVSDPARRLWLQGGLGALATGLLAGCGHLAWGGGLRLGFKGIKGARDASLVNRLRLALLANGVDIITCDDDGMITEFKVMMRPLQAINAVHAQMKAMLEQLAD